MILLLFPVFVAFAVGVFFTDLPMDQKLISAWSFLSVGAVVAGASNFGVRTFLRRTAFEPPAVTRPATRRDVLLLILIGWGLSWVAVGAYVAVTGRGASGGRWVTAVLGLAFGLALLLLAVRRRASRVSPDR